MCLYSMAWPRILEGHAPRKYCGLIRMRHTRQSIRIRVGGVSIAEKWPVQGNN